MLCVITRTKRMLGLISDLEDSGMMTFILRLFPLIVNDILKIQITTRTYYKS